MSSKKTIDFGFTLENWLLMYCVKMVLDKKTCAALCMFVLFQLKEESKRIREKLFVEKDKLFWEDGILKLLE